MVRRQLSAATLRSFAVSSNCTSFSASANVVVETSGPTWGAVPNAGGAPGVGCDGFCDCVWVVAAASKPRELRVMKCLRDFTEDLRAMNLTSFTAYFRVRNRKTH